MVDTDELESSCDTQETIGQVTARVLNRGEVAPVTSYSVRFFEDRNGNQTFDPAEDQELARQVVPILLDPGDEVDVSTPISAELLFAGNLIHAYVDPDNFVLEMDETNNMAVSGERASSSRRRERLILSWSGHGRRLRYSRMRLESSARPQLVTWTGMEYLRSFSQQRGGRTARRARPTCALSVVRMDQRPSLSVMMLML